jgi:predicted fused transcriptional regulator/phosphomethylpyrimidine kinase
MSTFINVKGDKAWIERPHRFGHSPSEHADFAFTIHVNGTIEMEKSLQEHVGDLFFGNFEHAVRYIDEVYDSLRPSRACNDARYMLPIIDLRGKQDGRDAEKNAQIVLDFLAGKL